MQRRTGTAASNPSLAAMESVIGELTMRRPRASSAYVPLVGSRLFKFCESSAIGVLDGSRERRQLDGFFSLVEVTCELGGFRATSDGI
jgi:hypothetical protein